MTDCVKYESAVGVDLLDHSAAGSHDCILSFIIAAGVFETLPRTVRWCPDVRYRRKSENGRLGHGIRPRRGTSKGTQQPIRYHLGINRYSYLLIIIALQRRVAQRWERIGDRIDTILPISRNPAPTLILCIVTHLDV